MKPKSKILIIAGSDSSGGAGIQADIKTVTELGGYAMTAITAITAQNTTGVSSVVPLHPKEIEKQILFTSQDIKPDAIKIGMLHSSEVILAVIRVLRKIKTKNTHGTGCTLSTAIATFFACGKSINKSCELGIKYVNQSIRSNLNYGKGYGPINHLSSINIDKKFK